MQSLLSRQSYFLVIDKVLYNSLSYTSRSIDGAVGIHLHMATDARSEGFIGWRRFRLSHLHPSPPCHMRLHYFLYVYSKCHVREGCSSCFSAQLVYNRVCSSIRTAFRFFSKTLSLTCSTLQPRRRRSAEHSSA
jgi:hypothetical protein